jgi:hypothetical protein
MMISTPDGQNGIPAEDVGFRRIVYNYVVAERVVDVKRLERSPGLWFTVAGESNGE